MPPWPPDWPNITVLRQIFSFQWAFKPPLLNGSGGWCNSKAQLNADS
jgi:hypothetical protein